MMDVDTQDQLMEDVVELASAPAVPSSSGSSANPPSSTNSGAAGTVTGTITTGGGREGREGKRPARVVVVDEAHPFELEGYIAGYSGRGAIYRLFHIMQHCPQLAPQAFDIAIQRITGEAPSTPTSSSTSPTSSTTTTPQHPDPTLYRNAVHLFNSLPLPNNDEVGKKVVDSAWIEKVTARNLREKSKLETELKTYQSNLIKESIRMAHRDLGDFYRATGDDASALKHYTKSREFCSSAGHVLEMCISVLELLLEQRNFLQVSTYVFKAEAAFDASLGGVAGSSSSNAGGPPASSSGTSASASAPPASSGAGVGSGAGGVGVGSAVAAEKERIQAKLDVATALAHFAQGNFEKAAQVFVRVGPPRAVGEWIGKIISPSDIAILGTLSALATYSREAIKAQVLSSETFGVYLEHEPHVRDLLEAYMGSKFRNVLEILERYSTRHTLDIHLHTHLPELTSLIRDRALVLYFKPFASIRLSALAAAFGVGEAGMERMVVGLIGSGGVKGRVDRRRGILKAKVVDQRAQLVSRALTAVNNIQAANRRMLLRMKLQQADLIVKAPRAQTGPGAGTGPGGNGGMGGGSQVQEMIMME